MSVRDVMAQICAAAGLQDVVDLRIDYTFPEEVARYTATVLVRDEKSLTILSAAVVRGELVAAPDGGGDS